MDLCWNENHNHRKLTKLITWITALSNSMKLWVIPRRATWTDRSWWRGLTKHGPLKKGMANHLEFLPENSMNQGSKYFLKIPESSKKQNLNFLLTSNYFFHLHCIYNFLHSIYIALCIISHLEIIYREGNGTPLQYSCLEDPMDGGAW